MKPEERKNHILDCAKKLFSKNGYYKTQISDIISEAGIARGTLYQYFKNKDDIYITLLEGYFEKWIAAMDEWAGDLGLDTISHVDFMKGRIKKNFAFFENDPDLCNILLRVGLGLPAHLESTTRKFEKRILDVTINDLKLGIYYGHINKNLDVELTANLLSGALLRAAYYYFGESREKKNGVDVEHVTEMVSEIFANGVFRMAQ